MAEEDIEQAFKDYVPMIKRQSAAYPTLKHGAIDRLGIIAEYISDCTFAEMMEFSNAVVALLKSENVTNAPFEMAKAINQWAISKKASDHA